MFREYLNLAMTEGNVKLELKTPAVLVNRQKLDNQTAGVCLAMKEGLGIASH